jgi:hypothetical protein
MDSTQTQQRFGRVSPHRPHRLPVWLAVFFLVLLPCLAQAQSDDNTVPPEHIRTLLLLIGQQEDHLKQELEALKQASSAENAEHRKAEILSQLDQLYFNFEAIATQHSVEEFLLEDDEGKTDLLKEVQELTLPLLHSLRDLTKKPRKIDKLTRRIETLEQQSQKYENASKNIYAILQEQAKSQDPAQAGTEKFLSRIKMLQAKYSPDLIRFQLQESRKALEREISDKRSLMEILADNTKVFFKHRGRNLLITLLVCTGVGAILLGIREFLIGKRSRLNISPRSRKVLAASYNIGVALFCIMAGLVSLYLLNDWLLLSFIIVVLLGIAWASRELVPRFFKELQVALNLGTVRENERFIWNGVPWRVESLGLSAKLVNDKLEDGAILLPLGELINKFSRPMIDDEPWFPTSKSDWVMLSDQTYGQIKHQTQEQVVLELKGGALKHYQTSAFLSLAPVNLSAGFRYSLEFGLDYAVQSRICDDIPKLFETSLARIFKDRLAGESPDFKNLKAQFDNAGSSSLNLKIIVDVDGRCADNYEDHRREIHKALVSVCNENNLGIPFNQLTLNLPNNGLSSLDSKPQSS